MPTKLKIITKQEQVNILAQYLRDDVLHSGKNIDGHPLRQILQALATLFLDFRNNLILLETEMDINKANALLDFYETLVGIPDDCLPIADTIELRTSNILLKFAWLQGNFKKQVEYILNLFGITDFEIQSGSEQATLGNAILGMVLLSSEVINYTMIIALPFYLKGDTLGTAILGQTTLGNATLETIKCLINKLKPAHVQILYQFFNDIEYQYVITNDDGYSILTDNGSAIFT